MKSIFCKWLKATAYKSSLVGREWLIGQGSGLSKCIFNDRLARFKNM